VLFGSYRKRAAAKGMELEPLWAEKQPLITTPGLVSDASTDARQPSNQATIVGMRCLPEAETTKVA
jgi:hypothetical protein